MKNTVDKPPTRQSFEPKHDELYREPLRAARGMAIAFLMVLLVWGLLLGAWWTVNRQHKATPSTRAHNPLSHSDRP